LALAPARWAAWAALQASEGRVVLGDASGTVWAGQARITLTGGPGSRDALTLPGQLQWRLGWDALAARVTLRHTEVMPAPVSFKLQAGWAGWSLALLPSPSPQVGALAQWPAAWLAALGTPWNTLQPSGQLRLTSPGLSLQWAQGRLKLDGTLVMEAADMASRLSTLPRLGSYRAVIQGGGSAVETATLQLSTLDGPLQLSGTGQWVGPRFRLRGEASAAPGQEAALQNLLNLVGRRDGARSILSIG
jgi:general secretion pathway protein N